MQGDRLTVFRVVDIPLEEVSGVCLRRGPTGELTLVAVGDRVAVAAWFVQPGDDLAALEWNTADVGRLEGSRLPPHSPDIEAVCADGSGRILLLQETPPRAELIDPAARRVVASIALEIPLDHELGRSWADPDGSRGEGAVLLPRGHLLVAKEKDPSALVEFGPAGETPVGYVRGGGLPFGAGWAVEPGERRFVPLATWMPDKPLRRAFEDFSDLEVGPDGHLYALSDRSDSIARLSELLPGGGTVTSSMTWRLGDLHGKPEGLAFTPNGRAMVALDTKQARENLVLLEPPIAAG